MLMFIFTSIDIISFPLLITHLIDIDLVMCSFLLVIVLITVIA